MVDRYRLPHLFIPFLLQLILDMVAQQHKVTLLQILCLQQQLLQILPAVPVNPSSFPPTQDLRGWCVQHALGKAEYQGLEKLGFHVGDDHELARLELSMWECIAPLAHM
jgi:hypothetical protein